MRKIALFLGCLLLGGLVLAPLGPQLGAALPYPAHAQFSDLTLTHWSAFEYARQQIAATGQVPLWRTSILAGTPFAENPLAGLFYPPHWLTLLSALPLATALTVLLWLHVALAAGTMYALLRRWQLRPVAALAGAVAYAATPKIVAHMGLGHLTLVEAWAWLPMVLYPLVRQPAFAHPERSRSAAESKDANGITSILSGLALGVCVLADARLAIYAGALAISYLIVLGAKRDRYVWLSLIGRMVIIASVAATVSAVAWLPTLSLTGNTSRVALAPDEAGVLSLDPVYLLGVLIADRSGAAERTTHVGLSVLVLALIGAVRARSISPRLRAWLVGVIVVGVVVALGTHTPLYALLAQLPGASLLRVPARAWFVVIFAVAVLAGGGLHTLLASIKRPSRQLIFAVITCLLIGLELTSVDWSVYRVTSIDEAFSTGRTAADWLARQSGTFRVYSPSLSIPQHVAQQFHLQLADGVDPLQLIRYVKFMQAATGIGAWGYSVTLPPFAGITTDADIGTALKDVPPNTALLGLLNVKYIVAEFPIESRDLIERARFDQTIIYENQRVLPRAFMVDHLALANSLEEAADWLKSADLIEQAVVEGLPFPIDLATAPRDVRVLDWQPDHIRVEATGPGLLVLSEINAPDWTVTLDGRATTIWPTDVALRGVIVPWGAHTIELAYQPKRVYAGALISVLSLIACGCASGLIVLKQRHTRSI